MIRNSRGGTFVILFLFFFQHVFAQADSCRYFVSGQVVDVESDDPLPYANIQVKDKNKGTVSDVNGNFIIEGLCTEEFDLVVSFIGYKTVLHHHDHFHEHPVIALAREEVLLEGVVVEGEYHGEHIRTSPLSEISGRHLEQINASSLGELPGNISGVSMLTSGQNVSKPMIHGLHSSRVLIINNGIRHVFQNWGADHAPEIDVHSVDRIEVVKGAATVKYGSEAMGGVLLVDNALPDLHTGLITTWNNEARSNGRGGSSDLTFSKGYDKVSFSLGSGFSAMGDLHAPGYMLSNTAKNEVNLHGALVYHSKKISLETYYSRFYQNLGILRGSVTENLNDLKVAIESETPAYTSAFDYTIENPQQKILHDLVKIKGSYDLNSHFLTATYSYQRNHRREFDVRKGTNNLLPSINLLLNSQLLDLEWVPPAKDHWEANRGIQWSYEDNNNVPGTNTYSFIPNFNNYRLGAYLIESYLGERNTYEAGLRFDMLFSGIRGRNTDYTPFIHEYSMKNFSGTLGWIHSFNNGMESSLNLATFFRPPNISELYLFGKHQFSVEYGLNRYYFDANNRVVTPNLAANEVLDIAPEKGVKLIHSLTGSVKKTQFTLTSYYNYIRDYIFSKPAGITSTIRGAFPYFIYSRTNASFYGMDVDAKWMTGSNWGHTVSLSYLYAHGSHGKALVEMPPPTIRYSMEWKVKNRIFDELAWSLEPSYTFKAVNPPGVVTIDEILQAESSNENIFATSEDVFDLISPPNGYFLMSSFFHLTYKKVNIQFRCNNILNKSYRSYLDRQRYFSDQTGRNFILTTKVVF